MSSDEGETSNLRYLDFDLKGGLGPCFPLPSFIKALINDPQGQAVKYQIRTPIIWSDQRRSTPS